MPRITTALLAALVVAGATAVVALGVGPAFASSDASLDSFDAHDPTCTDQQTLNSSASATTADGETTVVQVANVSLPHPNHELSASFESTGDGRYALNVTSEEGNGSAAQCLATARYVAELTIPEESDYTIEVYHDGERVSTITANGAESNASASD